MRRVVFSSCLPLFVACLVATGLAARADAGADASTDSLDAPRRARVVVRLGEGAQVTVGEIEDGIAAMPPFQRASFGSSPDAVRREYLDRVVVPNLLLSLGSKAAHLEDQLPTSYDLDRARAQAVVRAIRQRMAPASAIPMKDVQAYYDEHRARYVAPERIEIWRILCPTRDQALEVLSAAEKEPTPEKFAELAREHSVDKATFLRAGDLGFLSADGASNEPGLRVDPALVRAAQTVRDGDMVRSPVPEGGAFAVLWRRGTQPASARTVDQAAASIRDALWKARVESETRALIDRLRGDRVKDEHDERLDSLDVPDDEAFAGARAHPDAGGSGPAGARR